MKKKLSKFKIPTLLGLALIIFGITTGVFLTLREQIFISKASPDTVAQNITFSNISEDSAVISYQTSTATTSFLTYGLDNPDEKTILDDRDSKSPQPHLIHYYTLKNLLPGTKYQVKIISGKTKSGIQEFNTANPISNQTGFRPIIGSALADDKPLDEGIAYLSVAGSNTQTSLIKDSGNFIIPISQIRKEDLSDSFNLSEESVIKLTIISGDGRTSTLLFKLKDSENNLPPIKLGDNLDLTQTPETSPSASPNINQYDLNNDGKVNAADNAMLLQEFGKKGKNIKSDLNSDGVINQRDIDLMSKQINQ